MIQRQLVLPLLTGVFLVAAVGFAISTCFFYAKWEGQTAGSERLREELRSAQQTGETAKAHAEALKGLLGFDKHDALESIRTIFQRDMKTYGTGLAEVQKDYRSMLQQVVQTNHDLRSQVADLYNRNQKLQERFAAMEAACQKRLDVVQDSVEKFAADLAKQRKDFTEDRERATRMAEQLADQLEEKRQENYRLIAKFSDEMMQMQQQLDRQRQINEELAKRIDSPIVPGIEADGRITWTSARSGMVWVNVGSADELSPQTTFGVFPARGEVVLTAEPKGSIRITRIVDEHIAEAEIVESDDTDPLLRGDAIHSPIWDPGRIPGIAIAGRIDLDDDGKDDRDRFRSLVERNGSRIDADLTEDSTLQGQLTADTRYLVLGESPTDVDSNDRAREYSIVYEHLIEEAKTLGVERIGLGEFLRRMGWQPTSIVVFQ
jgi:hypothetical protein